MEKIFNQLSESLFSELNSDENLILSFDGEKSQFIRFNHATVRQTGLVDDGLELYLEAIQGAFRENPDLDGDQRLRASVAMLIHALNTFLAWRHLVEYGYLAEGRLFSRNIHESLTQALVLPMMKRLRKSFTKAGKFQHETFRKICPPS